MTKAQVNLRDRLVAAALDLVAEDGPHGVSVREVARRAGVSSGAPFRHFADKQALLAEAAAVGMQRLNALIDQELAQNCVGDPLDAFRRTGLIYVRFAVENPEVFRLMHVPEHAALSEALTVQITRGNERLANLIRDAQAAGQIVDESPELVMLAAQALLYGIARMFVEGNFEAEGIGRDQVDIITHQMQMILGRGIVDRATYDAIAPQLRANEAPPTG